MITTLIHPTMRPVRILPKEGRDRIVRQMHGAAMLVNALRRQGLDDCIRLQEPLAKYTTFEIGGTAQVMLAPRTEMELQQLIALCARNHVEPLLLGGGSKLLLVEEVIPVVIAMRNFKTIKVEGSKIYARAGISLTKLIKTAVASGLGGLEVLSGIPGTLGGALAGNAGSAWDNKNIEIGNFVEEVRIIEKNGSVVTLSKEQIEFSYRKSSLAGRIISSAVLRLDPVSDTNLLQQRYDASLRKKCDNQPMSARSAGCIFKNPAGSAAWKLIQQAGLAGKKIGAAMVSEKHANFIVNLGGARGTEVMELIQLVRRQVKEISGVDLSLEVKIW